MKNLTDFRKTLETGVDPRLVWGICSLVPRPVRAIRVTRGGLEPSEFSRQALQVESHPKSPRTTGNEAWASVD